MPRFTPSFFVVVAVLSACGGSKATSSVAGSSASASTVSSVSAGSGSSQSSSGAGGASASSGSGGGSIPSSSSSSSGAGAATAGAVFGAYIKPYPVGYPGYVSGQTEEAAMEAMETRLGRTFAMHRAYLGFGDDIALATATDRAKGRASLVSWDQGTAWSKIPTGGSDAAIAMAIANAKTIATASPGPNTLYLCFDHEADLSVGTGTGDKGTAADFVAAWQYIWNKFAAAGVTNVKWVWIMTHENFVKTNSDEPALWPGDSYVDYAAWDGYNGYPCKSPAGPAESFQSIFAPEEAFAEMHNKPWIVAEYGTLESPPTGWAASEGSDSLACAPAEDAGVISCDATCQPGVHGPSDPTAKAGWITAAAAAARGWPNLKAVLYFHSDSSFQWWIDTPRYTDTSPSFLAWKAMANDPYFAATMP